MSTIPELPTTSVPPSVPPQTRRRRLKQQYFALFALLVALPFVYMPRLQHIMLPAPPAMTSQHPVYIADLDYWQRTEREVAVTANAYFDLANDLNNVPLTVGRWTGEDVPETNEEVMILLDPEQYVQRLYQRDTGEYLWLSMIGGRSSRPFHAPDICYDADGWQYNLGSHAVALENGGKLPGLWLEAEKMNDDATEQIEHVVFYFYLFPNQARQLADGIVLFKLTSARYGSLEETLEFHADFIRNLFPGTMAPQVAQS
ncbi:MAG: exosortase-associated EpsI family protein [Caldilineaceae bacterium]|nr:exosortase-associated EpsI family protein [Caldilineaceae bacterium]